MKTKLFFLLFLFNICFAFGQDTFTYKEIEVIDVKKDSSEAVMANGNIASMGAMEISDNENSETGGHLSVSLTGGATYSIPIEVPPGINGVEPDISLTYNSQGGNGLAGYGWNISGISVITRIPSTEFHDGVIDPVDFDATDRYSFDGQRLLLKSGTYGQDGAEYQTENFSNVKIESFGSYYSGPQYFKVSYPDGSFAYYGQSYNSRSRTDYAITYWQNPQGARVSYTYTTAHNSLSISSIKYGSRGSNAPINEIQFEYGTRKRPEQSYIGGVRFIRKNLLKKIKILGNGTGYRDYELTHDYNTLGYERLKSVQEISGDNTQSYSPIVFNYHTTGSRMNTTDITYGLGLGNLEQRNAIATSFDLSGNGKMDFTIHPKTPYERDKFWLFEDVQENNSNITYPVVEVNTGGRFLDLFPVTWLTHNNKILSGQGLAIIQNSGRDQVKFKVYSKGTVTPLYYQYEKTWDAPTYYNEIDCDFDGLPSRIPQEYLSGDFNGDGLTDVIAISKPYSTQTCYPVLGPPGSPCEFDPLISTDGTNETVADTITGPQQETDNSALVNSECCRCETRNYNRSNVHFINLDRNLTSNFANQAGSLQAYLRSTDKLLTADVNGDGKTDIIQITNGELYVYSLDTNNSLELLWTTTHTSISTEFRILPGDYNGDGKMDFMIPTGNNSTSFALFTSTGNGFTRNLDSYPFRYQETNWNGDNGTLYGYNLIASDINGDGKTDIIDYKTRTYNNSSSGTQTIDPYYNTFSTSYYASPKFSPGLGASRSGDLKHFPIPIFLSSDKPNNNLDFASISNNKVMAFQFRKDNREDMLLRSIGKNGILHNITYHDLSPQTPYFNTLYQASYEEVYPYTDIKYAPGLKVVRNLERSGSGINTIKKDYFYYGAVSNFEGLGFAGFKGVASTNWHTDYNDRIYNVTKYDPRLRGAVTMDYSTTTYVNFTSNPTGYISKTTNEYNPVPLLDSKVFKLKLTSSSTQNLLAGTVTNKSFTYDGYNNPEKITTISGHGQQTVEFVYDDSPSGTEYFIGRPTSKITTMDLDGEIYVSEEQYTYNNHLLSQKKTKGNGTGFITEDFTYDAFGNLTGQYHHPTWWNPKIRQL